MECYELIARHGRRDASWSLEREGVLLSLTGPDGEVVFVAEPAHHVLDLRTLCGENRIALSAEYGSVSFRKHREALAAVKGAAEAGLAADHEARERIKQDATGSAWGGLVMFAVAGPLFGLGVWGAVAVGDPPAGTWLAWGVKWFGWLFGWLLIVLLAFTGAGLEIARVGVLQRSWVRRLERAAAAGGRP